MKEVEKKAEQLKEPEKKKADQLKEAELENEEIEVASGLDEKHDKNQARKGVYADRKPLVSTVPKLKELTAGQKDENEMIKELLTEQRRLRKTKRNTGEEEDPQYPDADLDKADQEMKKERGKEEAGRKGRGKGRGRSTKRRGKGGRKGRGGGGTKGQDDEKKKEIDPQEENTKPEPKAKRANTEATVKTDAVAAKKPRKGKQTEASAGSTPQQAAPTCGADNAVKAVLRFLYQDRHLQLRLPSQSWDLTGDQANLINRLHVLSDASHAPYRFNKRKGISGEVMSFQNSVVRTVAKQQQSTSLSSCEAELYAIQAAAQDSVSMSKFLYRYLFGLGEIDEMMKVDLWLESDSMSAIQRLHGVDLPRRSRHIEIRVLWMKSKIEDGSLQLHHRYGVNLIAQIYSQSALSGTRDFLRHRATLGFEGPEQPISSLVLISEEVLFVPLLRRGI